MPINGVKATKNQRTDLEGILNTLRAEGYAIIENFLSEQTLQELVADLSKPLKAARPGTQSADLHRRTLHGDQTKRVHDLVTLSPTFRDVVLDDDILHAIAERIFRYECGTYWLTSAELIEILPGSAAQPLHRDLDIYRPFVAMGPSGPEVALNFLLAITDFTCENGATRVVGGSHTWSDFRDPACESQARVAEMAAGDALLISGKTLRAAGANRTLDRSRCAITITLSPSYLTPEEAFAFAVSVDVAKQVSHRVQKLIGFRSQNPLGAWGLWEVGEADVAEFLALP